MIRKIKVNAVIFILTLSLGLHEIYTTQNYETKAPRADAPGNAPGAPVGSLLECDLSQVLQLLRSIKTSVIDCCNQSVSCIVQPITQALIDASGGALTINTPGNYALSENIASNASTIITINANDVTLDLCGRTINGFSGGSTADIGILINPELSSIIIKNGTLDSFATAAVRVSNGAFNITIRDLNISNGEIIGIQLAGNNANPIRESQIVNCQVSSCATDTNGLGGLVLTNCNTITVDGGTFSRNGIADVTNLVAGVLLISCTNCSIHNASMNENTGIQVFGVSILNGVNNTVSYCTANSNAGVTTVDTSTCLGFIGTSGLENSFENCIALMNTGSVAYGFGLVGLESLSSILGCRAESNVGTLPVVEPNNIHGAGVIIDGAGGSSFNEVQNNVIVRNNQSGIFDTNITFTISGGAGFVITGSSTTLVSGNSAVDNGLEGPIFDTTTPFSNYTVAYPTGQPVEFVSFRYSTGAAPVVSSAGDTMISNIDVLFS